MLICPVFPQTFRIINNLEKRFNFGVMNSCRQNKQAGEAARMSQALNTFCCLLLPRDPGLSLEQFLTATPECKSRELLEPGELTLIYRCALIPAAFIPSVFIPAAGTALEHPNCSLFPALWAGNDSHLRGNSAPAGATGAGQISPGNSPGKSLCPWGMFTWFLAFLPRVFGGSFSFAEVASSWPTEQCRWHRFSQSSHPGTLSVSYAWHSQLMSQKAPHRNDRSPELPALHI